MKLIKLRLAAVSVALIAAGTVPWLIQRESKIQLQDRIKSLEAQVGQLNQQGTEDQPLSSGPPQSNAPSIKEESRELLRLRGEVGVLRGKTNELLKLLAEDRQAGSDLASRKHQNEPSLTAGDLVPVESLTFAGYATPEATFQSTISSFARGDTKFLEGFTPERRQQEEKDRTGKSEADLAKGSAYFAGANVRILDSKLPSEDEAELVVYLATEKKNELTTISMKRIAGEWKISSEHH